MSDATVIRLFSDFAELALDREGQEPSIVTARLRGTLARSAPTGKERSALAVGDRVRFTLAGDEAIVEERRQRRTKISRRHPRERHREQVIAANVDQVLVVASAERPAFRERLVDRYLVAASVEGLRAGLCLTKCDLVGAAEADRLVTVYERLPGLPVFRIAGGEVEAVEKLRREFLVGRATVIVGQSGVGKSTLRNTLLPAEAGRARTGAVSGKWGKGRHVTTAATFEPLPPAGFLVDTPGIREFGLWHLEPARVADHFSEFAGHPCRFSDCSHGDEPNCALRALVEAGEASPSRLASLRALLEGT